MHKVTPFIFRMFFILFVSGGNLFSQAIPILKHEVLVWDTIAYTVPQGDRSIQALGFKGALFIDSGTFFVPTFYLYKELKTNQKINSVELVNPVFELCTSAEQVFFKSIQENIDTDVKISFHETIERKRKGVSVQFVPLKEVNGTFYKLISFGLQALPDFSETPPFKSNRVYASHSVLATGTWYKLAVTNTGIYKIDHAFLTSMGIDPSSINPNQIRIFGNGCTQLPYTNITPRKDDLMENSIYVAGSADGVFNTDDYILFYGTETSKINYNTATKKFSHQKNLYSDTTFYFLNINQATGLRITDHPVYGSFDTVLTSYTHFAYYEKDLYNLIKSGREWYGDEYNITLNYDYNFYIPDRIVDQPISTTLSLLGRSVTQQSSFTLSVDGTSVGTHSISVITGNPDHAYAQPKLVTQNVSSSNALVNIDLTFNKANDAAVGWLNYIELNAPCSFTYSGSQYTFNNAVSNNQYAQIVLQNSNPVSMLWDVTYPNDILRVNTFSAGASQIDFISLSDTVRQYIAFSNSNFLTPSYKGAVENQDLHQLADVDYVVVTHPNFISSAVEIAEFHTQQDGLNSVVVTTQQIFNEFSSGAQDATAIKDFLKMLYDKAASDPAKMPRYVLFMGDGSYDARGILSKSGNFIPTYQSLNSLEPANGSYVSDDYFALLDDTESDLVTQKVDIATGRLPVSTKEEAAKMVSKVKYYYESNTQKAWRNYITLIGDDEDSRLHMIQSDALSAIIDTNGHVFNIEKIFLDAYDQISSAGGSRYPEANEAINRRIERGTLITTYTGHGGELGWAHERILGIPDINAWTNKDNLTAMVTATCEFSRFDDPLRTSAGELVILNPDGGAIGLLTTTRLVYADPNFKISQTFFKHAFDRDSDGKYPRLGELSRLTKVYGPEVTNTRNFTLLGDPAVRLAYPEYQVKTNMAVDTMKALAKVTIKGYVGDVNGVKVNTYNGVLYPTVFDKELMINTLNNDGQGVFSFKSRKNVLFNGKASVKNGDFEFSFVIPKDIISGMDTGRISYYTTDQIIDGNGYFEDFVVGGYDSTATLDEEGPKIDLYLNDESFVFGGIANSEPKIYAVLEDENGINTTGSGIGHDIVAVLDGNTSEKIILNDYYESELDSYQKGKVLYPLSELAAGKHTLNFKAWDVHNNSSEAYLEFLVAENAELAISHVLNYPNPFTTKTGFYFEHNIPGHSMDVIVQIMSVSGKVVKTINTKVHGDGFRVGPIEWDGRDEYGDLIGKGVYIYRLKVIGPTGKTLEKIEKLVILK
jgi:hypothetical protein